MSNKKILKSTSDTTKYNNTTDLIKEITQLIDEARNHVAREYSSTQALLCWLIGKRIDEEVLRAERAEYGETIVNSLAKHLSLTYGKGYSRPNLFRMIRFAKLFPDREIVSTLSRQLSWSHFVIICSIDEDLKRDFYSEMCRVQRWSVRALQKQLNGMLYERTALSKKPEGVIKAQLNNLKNTDEVTPDFIFKEPYFLDFIGVHEYQSEEELESLILNKLPINSFNFIEDINVKQRNFYRRKFLTDTPSKSKRRSDINRYALTIIFCYQRHQEAIDNLINHLIHFIHQIKKIAESKQQKLDKEIGKRLGDFEQLYQMAEINRDYPREIIEDAVYPIVSQETIDQIIKTRNFARKTKKSYKKLL
jgi:predicted nuclease of restriction endonuclease-like (RecB) superfamily